MGRVSLQPWWRWPVYGLATIVVLHGCLHLFLLGTVAYRPSAAGVFALAVAIIAEFLLTSVFALRAIYGAKERRPDIAFTCLALSLLPMLILYLMLDSGVV